MVHFFEKGDFTNGGRRNTFIFCFEANLLQGDDAAGMGEIFGFVDDSICAWKLELEAKTC